VGAVEIYRDALFGNPPSSTTEPSREGSLAAFTMLAQSVSGATAGIVYYATGTERAADTAQPVGKIAKAANEDDYYRREGAGWVVDNTVYEGVAQIVQPIIDEGVEAAQAAAATAVMAAQNAPRSVASALPSDRNLYDPDKIVAEKAINRVTGALANVPGYFVTGPMAVIAGEVVTASESTVVGDPYGIVFTKVDGAFLSGTNGVAAGTSLAVPTGASFMQVTLPNAAKARFYVRQGAGLPDQLRGFALVDDWTARSQFTEYLGEVLAGGFNLFDPSKTTDNAALRSATGAVEPINGYFTSGYIPVTPGGKVVLNLDVNTGNDFGLEWLTVDKVHAGATGGIITGSTAYDVPKYASYMRFSAQGLERKATFAVYQGATVLPFRAFGTLPSDANRAGRWTGRTIGALGDSQVVQDSFPSWVDPTIAQLGGQKVYQFGKGGRVMREAFQNGVNVLSGNTTLVANPNPTFVNIALLWIMLGTNDYGTSTPLGALGDAATSAATSFHGNIRFVLETILTAQPTACRIAMMTPPHRRDANTPNAVGARLVDYVDAILRVAADYGVPVLDLYRTSGANQLNINGITVNGDGLHLAPAYAPTMIGKPLAAFCEGL
jgi:lysophospholipase L1-like esterase